jgi:hypothetical protein
MPLSATLDRAVGEPQLLFRASDASWAYEGVPDQIDRVTDGPFFYRTTGGELLLLWSSFRQENGVEEYAIGIARSASGTLAGPWRHDTKPLYGKDGGHGMVFRTFTDDRYLAIHTPNTTLLERPILRRIRENNDTLEVVG